MLPFKFTCGNLDGLFKISPQGGGEGGLKEKGNLITVFLGKKGCLLEREGLIEDLLSLKYSQVVVVSPNWLILGMIRTDCKLRF